MDQYDAIAERYAPGAAVPGAAPDRYDDIAKFHGKRAPQTYDPTEGMSRMDVSLAVFSRAVRNMGEGAKQRMLEHLATNGFAGPPVVEPWASMLKESRQGVSAERQASKPLLAAKGAFAGEAMGALPYMALPAVKGTGAAIGALSGLLEPLGENEGNVDLLKNIGFGTGAGKAGEVIGTHVIAPIAGQIAKAYRWATGKPAPVLTGEAAERAAAIQSTGAAPTRAQVTRSPADWTAEAQAAKASPGAMEVAAEAKAAQDRALKASFERMRQGAPASAYDQGLAVQRGVKSVQEKTLDQIDRAYNAARTAPGNDIPVHPEVFWERVAPVLEEVGDRLPPGVLRRLQQFQAGDIVKGFGQLPAASGAAPRDITIGTISDLYQMINRATKGSPADVRYAGGQLKGAIIDAAEQIPESAAPAWKLFRDATAQYRAYKQQFEPGPIKTLARTEEEAVTPELLARQVRNAGPGDLGSLRTMAQQGGPEAHAALHDSVLDYLVKAATDNGTGAFSGIKLKRAMETVGPDRLAAILSPQELSRLSQLMLAAESMLIEPGGTAINRSNTATTLASLFKGMHGPTMTGAAVGALAEPAVAALTGTPFLGPIAGAALGRASEAVGDRMATNRMRKMVQPSLEEIAAELAGQGGPGGGIAAGQALLPQMVPTLQQLFTQYRGS